MFARLASLLLCLVLFVSLLFADSTNPQMNYENQGEEEYYSTEENYGEQWETSNVDYSSGGENESKIIKYVIFTLLGISFISILLHFQGSLIIYRDYTDVTVTLVSLIIPIIAYIVFMMMNFSESTAATISLISFLIFFFFAFRMSYVSNKNFILTIMSLITKYTISLLYVIAIILIVIAFFFSGGKKKDELKLQYELRKRRQQLIGLILITITTAIFMGIVHITTKFKEWSPANDYFSLSFKRKDLNESVQENESAQGNNS